MRQVTCPGIVSESAVGSVLNPSRRPPENYQHLPLFAKLAIERLDSDHTLRSAQRLDELLTAYAASYGESRATLGEEFWDYVRFSAHFRCAKRFCDFQPLGGPNTSITAPPSDAVLAYEGEPEDCWQRELKFNWRSAE